MIAEFFCVGCNPNLTQYVTANFPDVRTPAPADLTGAEANGPTLLVCSEWIESMLGITVSGNGLSVPDYDSHFDACGFINPVSTCNLNNNVYLPGADADGGGDPLNNGGGFVAGLDALGGVMVESNYFLKLMTAMFPVANIVAVSQASLQNATGGVTRLLNVTITNFQPYWANNGAVYTYNVDLPPRCYGWNSASSNVVSFLFIAVFVVCACFL